MSELKATLHDDLTAATKSGDKVTRETLRMALTAIKNEEVSGKEVRELSDDEVIVVLSKEAKKRRESIEAYTSANRVDLADVESAELAVLEKYLPAQLTEAEIAAIIATAVEAAGAQGLTGMKALGAVVKSVTPQVSGRADGGAVAAAVKSALGA